MGKLAAKGTGKGGTAGGARNQGWGSRAGLAVLTSTGLAAAQLVGPGLPNLTYPSTSVYKTLSTFHAAAKGDPSDAKGWNAVAMHKGYLFAIYGEDSGRPGGGISFYDISDPRAPKLIHAQDVHDLRESHGFGFHSHGGKDYVAMQSIYGVHIWDITDVRKPALVKDFRIAGVSASDYDQGAWWVHWQAPYIFVARGQDGFSVVDAGDVANPKLVDILVDGQPKPSFPISKTGGFKLGPLFVVGNLLVATNMGTGRNPGYSTVDVSDPRNPRLLDTDNSTSCYSTFFNGGRLYCAGADTFSGRLVVHDMSDPANIKLVGQSPQAGARGEYVSTQDDYAHMGVEDRYAKFDTRTLSIVHNTYQLADSDGHCCAQEGFANVLGNLVLVTDDHSIGSSLIPHQADPDRNPPKVNMVSPRSGAVNQKPTSRIGVTFTDQIDVQSLGPQTFLVRPVGGQALPGRYSSQTNIVNFAPSQPLLSNTTYEVVVPAKGVKDYAGNATGEEFISRFSTGATVSLGAPRPSSAGRLRIESGAGGFAFRLEGAGPPGPATLSLRDSRGVLLRVLAFPSGGGERVLRWDGRTAAGGAVPAGLILATVETPSGTYSRNLVLP